MTPRALVGALLLILAAGSAGAADAVKPFARPTSGKGERTARVKLSQGERIEEAQVKARLDLKILVFVAATKARREIPFEHVALLRQRVEKQGAEKEWRWKEGGANEKIYTGRTYPWRQYGITVITTLGEVIQGKVTSGFPLTIRYRPSSPRGGADRAQEQRMLEQLNQNIGSTMTPAQRALLKERIRKMQAKRSRAEQEPQSKTFIINAKAKGKPGERLEDLVYMQEIDFTYPEAEKRRDKRLALLEEFKAKHRELEDLLADQTGLDHRRIEKLRAYLENLRDKIRALSPEVQPKAMDEKPPAKD